LSPETLARALDRALSLALPPIEFDMNGTEKSVHLIIDWLQAAEQDGEPVR
jgi:hypothetical protein